MPSPHKSVFSLWFSACAAVILLLPGTADGASGQIRYPDPQLFPAWILSLQPQPPPQRGRGRRRRFPTRLPTDRLKYIEAGEHLDKLEDELRKLELLTRDDTPELFAKRWEIADSILKNMRDVTKEFVEALWLESVEVEDLLDGIEAPPPMAPSIGVAVMRGSLDQLRRMWRRWRENRVEIDIQRYEDLQNEAVELIVTVDAMRSSR